eukprot:scaffold944_cov333-Pavlova_lutheri.AAC.10
MDAVFAPYVHVLRHSPFEATTKCKDLRRSSHTKTTVGACDYARMQRATSIQKGDGILDYRFTVGDPKGARRAPSKNLVEDAILDGLKPKALDAWVRNVGAWQTKRYSSEARRPVVPPSTPGFERSSAAPGYRHLQAVGHLQGHSSEKGFLLKSEAFDASRHRPSSCKRPVADDLPPLRAYEAMASTTPCPLEKSFFQPPFVWYRPSLRFISFQSFGLPSATSSPSSEPMLRSTRLLALF